MPRQNLDVYGNYCGELVGGEFVTSHYTYYCQMPLGLPVRLCIAEVIHKHYHFGCVNMKW